MANELIIHYPTGHTLYTTVLNSVGKVYNTTTTNFENPVDANWSLYDIAMTEAQNTEIYRGTMPTVPADTYDFMVWKQAGGSPAVVDIGVGVGHVEWDGTQVLGLEDVVGGAAGAGAITFVYTLTSGVDAAAIPDALVWATSDQAGTNVLASGTTNKDGQVTFYLDAGTVYIWSHKDGWNFSNPDIEVVA